MFLDSQMVGANSPITVHGRQRWLLRSDIRYAPLTGHYYRIDKGTPLPVGLAVIADGEDVGGNHSPTHHTIYPALEMPFSEFVEKFQACDWIYTGKKEII